MCEVLRPAPSGLSAQEALVLLFHMPCSYPPLVSLLVPCSIGLLPLPSTLQPSLPKLLHNNGTIPVKIPALWLEAPDSLSNLSMSTLPIGQAPKLQVLGLCPGPSLLSLSTSPGLSASSIPMASAQSLMMPPLCPQIQGFLWPLGCFPPRDPRPITHTVSQNGLSIFPQSAPYPGTHPVWPPTLDARRLPPSSPASLP